MLKNLDKNSLHHAYLIEGEKEEILPELFEFLKQITSEIIQINLDTFKINDARNLKSYSTEKGFSNEKNAKKIFIISANSFLLEAQNSMLKMFEEPIENTHFFVITPDIHNLLPTFVSRFYLISCARQGLTQDADKFIKMPLVKRMDFLKELLVVSDEEEEDLSLDSARSRALKFLNSVELALHKKFLENHEQAKFFDHLFKVRKFLRMPGSSPKTLMESVALTIPTNI